MNEFGKTVVFVTSAVILGLAALATHYRTLPRDVEGFERVGEEFFPEFTDPGVARSMAVTSYDAESDKPRSFVVEYRDGLWRIPSHYGYPAEAADRLARTASSLMGLRRESLAARRDTQHARYGVVDPTDESAEGESAGSRITLRDGNGAMLADYIIGKPAGSDADADPESMVRSANEKSDFYYVRVPEEKETYKARVNIDISTRFTDWIEPDLLKVNREDINRLEIRSYDLKEEMRGRQMEVTKMSRGDFVLTREGFSPWTMEGLDEATEQINTAKVNELVDLVDELAIAGVRPKPAVDGVPLVDSQLKINRELAEKDPAGLQQRLIDLQYDLEDKGFVIAASADNPQNLALLARQGELRATTGNGVAYTIYFGKGVTGDERDIEIGSPATPDDEPAASDESAAVEPGGESDSAGTELPEGSTEEPAATGDESPSSDPRNRYIAIRVDFDPVALGDPPTQPEAPVEPVKPEGYDSWKEEQAKKAAMEPEAGAIEESNQEMPDGEDSQPDGENPESGDADADAQPSETTDPASGDDSRPDTDDGAAPENSAPADNPPQDTVPPAPENAPPPTEQTGDEAPAPPADVAAATDEKFREYEAAMEEYEQAKLQHSTDLELYESDKLQYEEREKAGRELVKQLDERFAQWYYVVPATSVESVQLTRSDLVSPKEPPPVPVDEFPPGEGDELPPRPDLSVPSGSEEQKSADENPDGG